ncbi:MAG: alpha amylase C-terminal domain-containing protein [Cytophagaceae bacterium]|jgi:1,4-alpha-glucan branching enzyme|nr:alpha amylase C-terminal domain-containing protein [Cytophagaceae bacterium]
MNLLEHDPWLKPFAQQIDARRNKFRTTLDNITSAHGSLEQFANNHHFFGLHSNGQGWIFREWAPNAHELYIVGVFSGWKPIEQYRLQQRANGVWVIQLPANTLKHGDLYKLWMVWTDGAGMRIPAYATRTVQDDDTKIFSAQVWDAEPFMWNDGEFKAPAAMPLIYEAHVGMAQEEEKVGSFNEFTERILPRVKQAGYNVLQLMAIQEHPYYGSFGYHVSNFFAVSSRFGTPEELKHLINEAHSLGIAVIMDIVHSHSVKNEEEGLGHFDGTYDLYFYSGERGFHPAWDSRCFDYGKNEALAFLLSNCRYWIEEFHFDGFRFDGVTSMLYLDHGLERAFTSYSDYFSGNEDENAITYLALANKLIHDIKPDAITIAEDMSGFPGTAIPPEDDGLGFDYRLSMGVPDLWIKIIKEKTDEEWSVGHLFYELCQRRPEEKIVAYAESHDQALVGDKTIMFRLADKAMYDSMAKDCSSLVIDRAIALHKMIRLITITTAYSGYLNFMGNEFGHPEWIDFPRDGNGWSHKYARRQWSLQDSDSLKFEWAGNFDRRMIECVKAHRLLMHPHIQLRHANEKNQVLAFERGELLMIFNFSPANSYTDYEIAVGTGKFKVILDSDSTEFGGFNRVDASMLYFSQPSSHNRNSHHLKLYIPSRTAIVMERQASRSVYEL